MTLSPTAPMATEEPDVLRELLGALVSWLPAVSGWIWIVAIVLLGAIGWWYFRERSARGVSRRSRRSSKRAAGAVGVVGVGLMGVVMGLFEGFASAGTQMVGAFAPYGDELGQVAISVAGYYSLRGEFIGSATLFLAFCALLILLSAVWGE